jgi:hypothetical protein
LQLLNGNPKVKKSSSSPQKHTLFKTVSHCHTHKPKPLKIEKRTRKEDRRRGEEEHIYRRL